MKIYLLQVLFRIKVTKDWVNGTVSTKWRNDAAEQCNKIFYFGTEMCSFVKLF